MLSSAIAPISATNDSIPGHPRFLPIQRLIEDPAWLLRIAAIAR